MKIRIGTVILLCFILGCQTGCGSREETKSSCTQEEKEEQQAALINRMELLQSEDPEQENLADLLQRAGGGMMVQLRAGSLLGSGVICGVEEDRLLILTAAHVLGESGAAENAAGGRAEGGGEAEKGAADGSAVESAGKAVQVVTVIFPENVSVSTEDYECFESGDFAVVRVRAADVPEETLSKCLYANIDKSSFDAAMSGQGCIVMGSRSGVAAEAYEGVILDHWIYMEDYGQYMMWVKAEGKQGMSGGGLFDRQGHFLGIISGGNEDGELAVVPLSLIWAELAEWL